MNQSRHSHMKSELYSVASKLHIIINSPFTFTCCSYIPTFVAFILPVIWYWCKCNTDTGTGVLVQTQSYKYKLQDYEVALVVGRLVAVASSSSY